VAFFGPGGDPLGEPVPADGGDGVQLGSADAGNLLAGYRPRDTPMLISLGGKRDLG
jgi:hypothetical protein